MRIQLLLAAVPLLGSACGQSTESADGRSGGANAGSSAAATAVANDWSAGVDMAGAKLVFHDASGAPAIRLTCPRSGTKLSVNVPSFDPVGSEERLTFGSGREVITLVADSEGDTRLGGVTAEGVVPSNLNELLAGPVSVNYGSQDVRTTMAPPAHVVKLFAAVCAGKAPSPVVITPRNSPAGSAPRGAAELGACRIQERKEIPANRIRAVGTEPFWGARVEGRCVNYSHPDDQSGTRVWTKFSGTAQNGTWSGSLGGQPFVMKTRPQPGCSDGMSDMRYPIAVSLTVNGEQRSGCAEPR